MSILRNVHDPIPVNFSNAEVAAFTAMLRERLDIRDAAGLQEAFVRLGGTYRGHIDTFGLDSDAVVVRGPSDVRVEGDWRMEHANMAIAEGLATLFLHHPLVMNAHGDDAVTAVSRIEDHPEPARDATRRERIVFGTHLTMPAEEFRKAHARDPSVISLAKRFMVFDSQAAFRCKGLGLEPTDVYDRLRQRVWGTPPGPAA